MTAPTATPKPMPEADEASAAFYDAAARGILMIKACGRCSAMLRPDATFCSECLSEDLSWKESSGRGTLFTFGIMHQKFPGFENDVPYNIAVVQLEEGPRMSSNIVNCDNDALQVGMPLRVVFQDAGNGTPIPRWEPA
jgi:uncharacterized protein